MQFASSRAALADKEKSGGGFFSRIFGRKESSSVKDGSMSDSDTVKISINVDVDDDDKKKSSTRTASRPQTTSKKKAVPNPSTKAASEHPRKSSHPSEHRSRRKKSAGATTSRALEKRRRKHREMEKEEDIGIAAFGSTKQRLDLRDEIAADEENTDALMDGLSDDVVLDDCAYTEEEPQGMADKEPTEAQAAKLNRINERLRDLELVLGEKYRAGYSSRSERGYVLRKYVGVSEKLETWGDPYLSRRPIGIGGKTLERVFANKHGISWEDFARESATVRDIRAKIEKHNFTSTPNLRKKAETKAIRERQAEEHGKAKAADAQRTKKETEAKAETAKAQEQKAEKAQKTAKVVKAKEPRKTKTAAKKAEENAAAEEMSELDKALLAVAEKYS